jgi:hypothetical protein
MDGSPLRYHSCSFSSCFGASPAVGIFLCMGDTSKSYPQTQIVDKDIALQSFKYDQ